MTWKSIPASSISCRRAPAKLSSLPHQCGRPVGVERAVQRAQFGVLEMLFEGDDVWTFGHDGTLPFDGAGCGMRGPGCHAGRA